MDQKQVPCTKIDYTCPNCSAPVSWTRNDNTITPHINELQIVAAKTTYPYIKCICGHEDKLQEEQPQTPQTITLQHIIKDKELAHDEIINAVLEGCTTIGSFTKRLHNKGLNLYHTEESEEYKHFVGNAFEIFCEFLIKTQGANPKIGITEYKPTQDDDYGVDGHGIGNNGRPATVQCKYRHNPKYLLTNNKDHISNFYTDSISHYNVDPNSSNMLIITTGAGIQHNLVDRQYNNVRVLNRKNLKHMVDGIELFWQSLYHSILESRTKHNPSNQIQLRPHQKKAVKRALNIITGD